MNDLTAFITARLAEDEAAAKAAWGVEWDWRYVAQPFGERPSIAHTVHIARHDPARVLREVEAKRAILARHYMDSDDYIDGDGIERAAFICHECDNFGRSDNWPCPTIRDLAAVWSDHPDYRAEWKP